MKTTEGNRLIADFMGAKNTPIIGGEVLHPISGHIISYKDKIYQADFNTMEGINNIPPSGRKRYFEEDLKYHSDWNWFMPVVQKCRDMNHYQYKYKSIEIMLCSLDLQGVWGAVVEFIQWYNLNKKL